jgi:hypothetical protein
VESLPGKVSGAWVFKGTRTPVAIVFENLEDGMGQGRARVRCPQSRRARTWALMRILFDNGGGIDGRQLRRGRDSGYLKATTEATSKSDGQI